MTVSVSRLVSTLTAGGVLAGSLFLASGAAEANPRPPGGGTVPATCGQTVTAYPGDRVKVTPTIGIPFAQTVTPGMGPVAMSISGLLCSVKVTVLKPVAPQLTQVAPPLGSVATTLTDAGEKVLAPESSQAAPALVPAPRAAAPQAPAQRLPSRAPASGLPSSAPLATLPPGDLAAAAPLFAPTFTGGLPSSFLASGSPAPGARLDAGSLFGSAFPGMRAGAPAFLGYEPASAVTTASQVQALPVDGLSEGVGLPAILAVLGLSGAAAFAVRRMVLGAQPALAAPAGGAAPTPVEPAEETALVAAPVVAAPADAEVTAMTPPVDGLDPAEVTAVTPGLAGVPVPAEVTGVIDPVRGHDEETTGVLASTASH